MASFGRRYLRLFTAVKSNHKSATAKSGSHEGNVLYLSILHFFKELLAIFESDITRR